MEFLDKLFGRLTTPKPPEMLIDPVSEDMAEPTPTSHLADLQADFPFPLSAMRGDEVEAEVIRLRGQPAAAEGAGGLSVITGDAEETIYLLENMEAFNSQNLEVELVLAEKFDVPAWLALRKEEDTEFVNHEDQAEIHAEGTAPMNRLTVGPSFTNVPREEVFVATVPAKNPCELPVRLRFGGWNACPMPHVHMALARYWHERYGAEIVTVSGSVIEYVVARPPTTDEQAAELALEQCVYCEDIVTQGVGSVATLARVLRHSTRWYFWWD